MSPPYRRISWSCARCGSNGNPSCPVCCDDFKDEDEDVPDDCDDDEDEGGDP